MRCPSCASTNPPDASFCGSCGLALTAEANFGTTLAVQHDLAPVSDATRYLCAAVQLDAGLAERVVRDILHQEFKALPWSPGVDLVSVVRYALLARGRQVARDVGLLVLLVLFLFTFAAGSVAALLVLVLAWGVMVAERWVATYVVMAHRLGPPSAGRPSSPPRFGQRVEGRLAEMVSVGEGNVGVYGSFSPFIGSGVSLDAWSFALDVDRAAEGRQVEPFSVLDIHRRTEADLRRLELAGMSVDNRVFVDGRDVRGDQRFLAHELGRPVTRVDEALLSSLMVFPEDRARPYLCLRVAGWRGQLVLSTFLRFALSGNKLFVELSHSLLAPVLDAYQEVDRLLPRPTPRQFARLAVKALRGLPRAVLLSPYSVVVAAFGPLTAQVRGARQRREITSGLRFNYGATTSPREAAADPRYQRYFQQLDKELYSKVVERQILRSVTDFLDEKGVDTGELRERQTTIMNNGVYVAGGSLTVDSLAVGKRAKASSFMSRKPVPAQGAERS